ncbi:hypothetical protein [Roseibium aestuarii]|uniref:Serine/threonine protein kinase n=1 Tax=Roseibium aestuarii TaxID=2600299 RepID=A0ABW4K188_9HYPH|nr:hypothetical protein [Roseibium aestuarii]
MPSRDVLLPRLAVLLALCAGFLAAPLPARAQSPVTPERPRIYCPLPEHGIWINDRARPKELTRLEVETRCENNQVHARVRAFTSCIPRDCKWGWTTAEFRDGGGLRATLIGFYMTKLLEIRGAGDRLDAKITEVSHDAERTRTEETYSLRRK